MKNQKGFSLIELLIVVTLLAISIGVGGITIRTVYSQQAKRCLTSMKSGLSQTRVMALSMDSGDGTRVNSLRVYKGDEGYYMDLPGDAAEPELICDVTVKLTYVVGENMNTVDENGVNFTFNRSSGALNKLESGGEEIDGTDVYYYFLASSGMRTYTLAIYPDTGKFYLE